MLIKIFSLTLDFIANDNKKIEIIKNLIKFALSPIKKDNEIKNIIKRVNFKLKFFFINLAIVAIYIPAKHRKKDPTINSLPKKLAILPGIIDFIPIVLQPKIISNKISIIKIENKIAQLPNKIFSKYLSYLLIIFLKNRIKEITAKILRTLGNEIIGSILKFKFINKEIKKIISNKNILSFMKEKFLFKERSIKKTIKINKKLIFIIKFPKIKLIGKNIIKIKNNFSVVCILLKKFTIYLAMIGCGGRI